MPLSSPRPPSLMAHASYLATQVAKAAQRALLDALDPFDVRLPHYAVLAALDDLGDLSQQELADVLDIDKSHMVGFIDELADRSLVSRDKDPQDRRRHRIAVTAAGRRLLRQLHAAGDAVQDEIFGVLPGGQRDELVTLLQRVVTAYDESRGLAGVTA